MLAVNVVWKKSFFLSTIAALNSAPRLSNKVKRSPLEALLVQPLSKGAEPVGVQGCQMAIANFLDCRHLALRD